MTKHEKKCYTGRQYPCNWQGCKHINSQKSLLHQHIKAIHYNDLFRCQVCNEPSIYKKLLQKHAKKVHDTGLQKFKYNCPQCAKGTDDRTEFTVHMDRHVNIKCFKSNMCDQAFYLQSQLTVHNKNSCSHYFLCFN